MLERGAVRVSPASAYRDPSLNPAIHDDELTISLQPHPDHVRLEAFTSSGQPKGVVHPANLSISAEARTNYYVYCLSSVLGSRLFLDFDSDACLVLTDPQRFFDLLMPAMRERLPRWSADGVSVTYIDPLTTPMREVNVFRNKHFRFAYQREFRVVWLPPENAANLPVVELGGLQDCCDLVTLG